MSSNKLSGNRRTGLPLSLNDTHDHGKSFGSHSRRGSLTSPLATASTSSGWLTVLYIPVPPMFGRRRSGPDSRLSSPTADGGYHPPASSSYYPSSASSAYPQQPKRHLKIYLPIPHALLSRVPFLSHPTPLRLITLLAVVVTIVLLVTGLKKGKRGDGGGWTEVFRQERESVVLTKEEVARIWEWEVLSGHHPSLTDGEFRKGRRDEHDIRISNRISGLHGFGSCLRLCIGPQSNFETSMER